MAKQYRLPKEVESWITQLAGPLHARLAGRFLPLLLGALFAQGRRTVACWLRCGGLGSDFRAYYYFLGSLGCNSKWVAGCLWRIAAKVIPIGDKLVFALDDTPTKRYGRHVEGAGIHHNPTPGPAEQKFLYGHVWVTLSWVVQHPLWGAIGLPLWALLYVRQKNMPLLRTWYKLSFRTKLQMAAEMVEWLATRVSKLGKPIWLVTDGGYAKRTFLQAAKQRGITVVTRLRKDACLYDVPKPSATPKRGRPRIYGKARIDLAKRAAHPRGWQTEEFTLYGKKMTKRYKTFVATYKPAGGLIRVLIVKEDDGSWRAYFCTDLNASTAEILGAVADRSTIEQNFHDVKEVHGAGQQQVRNYWANIAAYHVCLWWYTLIELWAWHKPPHAICDRSARPWDDPTRRPSHADRRNALRRLCLENEFQQLEVAVPRARKIRHLFTRLLRMAG